MCITLWVWRKPLQERGATLGQGRESWLHPFMFDLNQVR